MIREQHSANHESKVQYVPDVCLVQFDHEWHIRTNSPLQKYAKTQMFLVNLLILDNRFKTILKSRVGPRNKSGTVLGLTDDNAANSYKDKVPLVAQ